MCQTLCHTSKHKEPQGAYTLVGRQTHKQIITMGYNLCKNEGVYKVQLHLKINAALGLTRDSGRFPIRDEV